MWGPRRLARAVMSRQLSPFGVEWAAARLQKALCGGGCGLVVSAGSAGVQAVL